jgi:hypothetical protein
MNLISYKNITVPEFRLLISSSKNNITEEDSKIISELINERTDWSLFFTHLLHHRLIPFVYENLLKFGNKIPDEINFKLRGINEKNTLRMLLLSAEIIKITQIFDRNRIELISLKGPVLSYQLYGNPAKRSSRDIDFLVHPDNMPKAVELIAKLGYTPFSYSEKISGSNFKIIKKIKHNLSFNNSDINVIVELHWRLSFHNYFQESNQIFDNLPVKDVNFQQSNIKVLDNNWQMLYLAVHGSKHKWSSLYWLKDFNDFGLKFGQVQDVIHLAEKTKSELSVLQALTLANIFYEFQLPFEIKTPKSLMRPVFNELNFPSTSGNFNDIRRIIYLMKLRHDLSYKIGCIWGVFYRFAMRICLKIKANK